MINKKEIERMINKHNNTEYSHVIICQDSFNYDYFPIYVKYKENIHNIIREYNNFKKMTKIMEVYNYNLDITKQLNEQRAYNINPIIKKEELIQISKIELAKSFATKKHNGQKRLDGKDYITHPIKVAEFVKIFKESKNIEDLICASYLHDTLEDTDTTFYELTNIFGPTISNLVQELTTNENLKNELGKTKYLQIKMNHMTNWALTIKLCDRLSNIKDISSCKLSFINKYIIETLEIIEYLLDKRILNNTQLNIIKNIIKEINILLKNNNIKLNKAYILTYTH